MKFDVVIVGAGPAGLKAAEVLASNGKNVIVFEKNNVIGPKVCAGGLTKKCVDLGIPSKLFEREFNSIKIHSRMFSTDVKHKLPFVVMISRKELGQWQLKQAEKAGAEVNVNSRVTKIGDNYVVVNEKKVSYGYLIGADGSNSILRKHLGIRTEKVGLAFHYLIEKDFNDMELFFNIKNFGQWYAWIFPHKGYTSIGTGGDPGFMKTSVLKKNLELLCKKKGVDVGKAKFEAALVNIDYRGTSFGNKFLVGDASGYASGLTGEGIYFGIVHGSEVARKIIDVNYDMPYFKKELLRKKRQEFVAGMLRMNNTLTKIEHNLFVLLIKNKVFRNYFIKLCC